VQLRVGVELEQPEEVALGVGWARTIVNNYEGLISVFERGDHEDLRVLRQQRLVHSQPDHLVEGRALVDVDPQAEFFLPFF